MRIRSVFKSIAVLVPLGTILASCNFTPYAARINGTYISQNQLNSELNAISANPTFVSQLEKSQGSIHGSGTGTYSSAFTAEILNRRISVTLVQQALAKRHITVTPQDLAVAYPVAAAGFGGAAVFSGFPKSYQATLVSDTAAIDTLEASLVKKSLSASSVNQYYNQNLSSFTEYCSSEILATTQAQAQSLAAKISAGAAFATIASKYSKDPNTAPNGGAVGCGLISQYSSAFGSTYAGVVQNTKVNQVSQPFQGTSGWYLVEVTSEPKLSESQAEPTVVSNLLGASAPTKLASYIQAFAKSSNIAINPSYGNLSLAHGQIAVLPPSAPSPAARNFFPTPA